MKLWIRIATPLMLMSFATVAHAQFAGSYGYGMWGGMQSCPYKYGAGASASSEDDEVKEIQQSIIDLQKQQKQKKTELSRLASRDMRDSKNAINGVLSADYADFVINHIDSGRNCNEYKGIGQADANSKGDDGGSSVTVDEGGSAVGVQAQATEETNVSP